MRAHSQTIISDSEPESPLLPGTVCDLTPPVQSHGPGMIIDLYPELICNADVTSRRGTRSEVADLRAPQRLKLYSSCGTRTRVGVTARAPLHPGVKPPESHSVHLIRRQKHRSPPVCVSSFNPADPARPSSLAVVLSRLYSLHSTSSPACRVRPALDRPCRLSRVHAK